MNSLRIKTKHGVNEIIELHEKELELIKAIRNKFRYGEITIITRDGLPFRIKRTIEYDDLTNKPK